MMMRMRRVLGARAALFAEYVVWNSLIAAVAYGALVNFVDSERVRTTWASPNGALILFSVVHGWLTVPLSLVLAVGYLIYRAGSAWRVRHPGGDQQFRHFAAGRWPLWPIVYSGQAALIAVGVDAAFLTLVDLKPHGNFHWLLYPWAIAALGLLGVWTIHALFWPVSTGDWDWFGEAVLAAVFSSMIPVVGMGWVHFSDDPLTADLAAIQPVMFAVAMIPIALMVMRRGLAWAWRRWR